MGSGWKSAASEHIRMDALLLLCLVIGVLSVTLRTFEIISNMSNLFAGFDSNCCNGVTSNKSHSSSPHSHKPCPPGSGSTLPASDISLNGSRSQQPITRYGNKALTQQ